MTELDKALADIGDIRSRLAAGTTFQGFGPFVIAITAVLALVLGVLQYLIPSVFAPTIAGYLIAWVVLASVSSVLIGIEMYSRTRRFHGGMADAMLVNAIEQFIPAALGGILLTVVFFRFQPEMLWVLPGLWQLLLAVGLFASAQTLIKGIKPVAGWYFVCAFVVLVMSVEQVSLSPWLMAVPFFVGQLLTALVLKMSGASVNE